ncbi:hypothetical protein WN944_000062 [Citrus x changshan-huyou]|uniref:Photolyase/cryptochrome alpha/beta domain-containing protein n=1 Tax=Citrus x changshan-huyou TaxID=2935761 RepID=A0AAP0QPY3_9ROSI
MAAAAFSLTLSSPASKPHKLCTSYYSKPINASFSASLPCKRSPRTALKIVRAVSISSPDLRTGPDDLVASILSKVNQSDGGVSLTKEEHKEVAEVAQELQKYCVEAPVKCPLIFGDLVPDDLASWDEETLFGSTGEWDVVYCSVPTSPGGGYRSAFGRLFFKTKEMIQAVEAPDTVRNKVSFTALGLLDGEVSLKGKLNALDEKWIQVVFEPPELKVGGLEFRYGGQSEVKLQITYIDEKIRLGNFSGKRCKYAGQSVQRALPIRVITVGKKRSLGVQLVVDEYIGKLKYYCKVEDVQLRSNPKNTGDVKAQIKDEDMAVMNIISSDDWVVMLDENGLDIGSEQMAELMGDAGSTGASRISFCIGGPYGHGPKMRERANISIKLSSMVLNHQIALLVLVEQLYRIVKHLGMVTKYLLLCVLECLTEASSLGLWYLTIRQCLFSDANLAVCLNSPMDERFLFVMVIPGADSREINHVVEETFGRYTSKALKRNGKGVAIVWFRNDLRVLDNEALLKAWDSSEMVLPVYCVDPRHFQTTYHFGFPKTGALRAQFLMECLADLRKNLMNRGLNLLIRHGKPEEIIPSLAKLFGAHAVYAQKETCSEELNVERLVRKNLQQVVLSSQSNDKSANHPQLKLIWGTTMYHLDDIPFDHSSLPDVYTQFRKASFVSIEAKCTVRGCIRIPSSFGPPPSVVDWGSVPLIEQLGLHSPKASSHGTQILIYDAFRRIKNDLLKVYKETRNEMLGPDYSTKFSPWLASGSVSPRYIYEEVAPENWRTNGVKTRNYLNPGEMAAQVHFTCMFLQIVCSFLVRDMGIDWRMGAEWFETCLLDYDPCSNYGNWTYGAGVGNDPREDRYFRIPKQAQNYDPEGEYVAYWLPQLNALPKERRNFPGGSYIEQIVSLKHGNINQNRNQNDGLTRTGRRNNFGGKHAQVNR